MSELKARHVADVYDDYAEHPCGDYSQVYLKSEADRYIAHQKRKRCEAMAIKWGLIAQLSSHDLKASRRANKYAELAEKFKEIEK